VSKESEYSFDNELIRVVYEGKGSSKSNLTAYYDSRNKVTVNLEFNEDARELYKNIKHSPFAQFIPNKYQFKNGSLDLNRVPLDEHYFPAHLQMGPV
jgi:hypothetical protein